MICVVAGRSVVYLPMSAYYRSIEFVPPKSYKYLNCPAGIPRDRLIKRQLQPTIFLIMDHSNDSPDQTLGALISNNAIRGEFEDSARIWRDLIASEC